VTFGQLCCNHTLILCDYLWITISVTDIVWYMATANPNPPLTPAVFHILLALSSGERHGYGIMKQVEADSQGKVHMGAGTLYGSLKRMVEAGLVKESDKRIDPEMDDERRIYYQITGSGTKALAAELERYEHLVTLAQERKLLPKTFAHGV
jgi:DNA-binding PadR family transcriptional regulator